ncbi:hypothetical protein ABMA79_07275 [Halobacteriovorax sp. HFRX-2_2]|uniref:hypothetical protein n=1 Tax=unclassified Halobacteriovorax TaxID=2639665 RepID=UPI00371ACE45
MKKVILSLILATGLSFNASAAVGMLTGNCYIAYTGLLAMKVGVGYSVKAIFSGDQKDWVKAAKIGLAGLILLDDEGLAEFGPVYGSIKGVNADQIAIYNSEVEEANLILEEVVAQMDRDTSVAETKEIWARYESSLSPETLDVMRAIVSE